MFQLLPNAFAFELRKRLPRLRFTNYREVAAANSLDPALLTSACEVFSASVVNGLNELSLRTNLFYHWILQQISFGAETPSFETAVDLGSKHFVYAPALAAWAHREFGSREIVGLEADPYRFYRDLYRRGDYAKYYCDLTQAEFKQKVQIKYECENWLVSNRSASLITCFFPFLYGDLNQRWGLPKTFFDPAKFYQKTLSSAKAVVFFHQGEEEAVESERLISNDASAKIVFKKQFFENPYMKRKFPVFAIVAIKAL